MKSPDDPTDKSDGTIQRRPGSVPQKVRMEEVLQDLHAGLRTRGFLRKYDLEIGEFQDVLKRLIREGHLTREDFMAWKAHRPTSGASSAKIELDEPPDEGSPRRVSDIETVILSKPEKNHSWALELFSTKRERVKGARFKVNLQGKKYSFVVEDLLFRGSVTMLEEEGPDGTQTMHRKRQEAVQYIAQHGWSAYLENRALMANLENGDSRPRKKARLVLLRCRNETFVAALHTPTPAVNLYVASSLEHLRERLAKTVEIGELEL